MKRLLLTAVVLMAGMTMGARAQQAIRIPTCGTAAPPAGAGNVYMDATGLLCTAASVSASISGFTAASVGTPISVTTGGVAGTLPAGAVVVASNPGAINTAYCALGASATTANQPIPPGGWFAFTVGASTQLTCITSTSTTTVNMVGGAGLPTGSGGGGSGGGAVTIADGADATQGAIADAAATAGSTGTISAKLRNATALLNSILTAVGAAIPAGSAIIGKVGIDQTTPGTTNAVALTATEAHAGEVGGNSIDITNAMTTSNNSITTGEALGGLQTLANAVRVSGSVGAAGTSGILQKVMISFTDAVAGTSADVYFFNANPSGSTCTDNTAFALVAADRAKVIGIAHVTDFTASNTSVIAQANNLAMPFSLASATSLFACVVSRSTWAVTGTTNASLIVSALRN